MTLPLTTLTDWCIDGLVLIKTKHLGLECLSNESTFVSFQSLLHDPNPNSPANNEAAQLYRENRREYEKKVAAIVQASWNDED